jgi:hypothetical protein
LDNKKNITATVCIYSGRPNPQWELGKKEYSKLLLAIEKLAPANSQEQQSQLGYSGLLVSALGKTIYLFNKVITISVGNKTTGYADTDRRIERQLFQSAPAMLREEIKAITPEDLL